VALDLAVDFRGSREVVLFPKSFYVLDLGLILLRKVLLLFLGNQLPDRVPGEEDTEIGEVPGKHELVGKEFVDTLGGEELLGRHMMLFGFPSGFFLPLGISGSLDSLGLLALTLDKDLELEKSKTDQSHSSVHFEFALP